MVYFIYFLHLTQPLCDLQNGLYGGKLTGEEARVRWAGRPTEQQAGEHRLHNNECLSTVQPARLLICGRGWLWDNANAPCAARQLLHKRILLPWQKRNGEAGVVMEGQFVQHEETGLLRLQGQNKEAIIDESAQHQSRSEITLSKQSPWRQAKRETEAFLHTCMPTLSCVFFIFSHSPATIVQRRSWKVWTIFPTNSGTGGKLGERGPSTRCLISTFTLNVRFLPLSPQGTFIQMSPFASNIPQKTCQLRDLFPSWLPKPFMPIILACGCAGWQIKVRLVFLEHAFDVSAVFSA